MKLLSIRLPLCVSIVLLLLSVPGCREEKTHAKSGQKVVAANTANVVAKVWDEEITEEDLALALERYPARRRGSSRDKALNRLISVKVFAREARRAGLEKEPEVKEELAKSRRETLAQWFIRKHIDKQATPSEEDIRRYYEEHKDAFLVPDSVKIQHLVVKDERQARRAQRDLESGRSFEELIKKRSISRDWLQKGISGWLFKGKIDPALEEVSFNLRIGQLSDIVKTDAGYEIVKVLDRRDERQLRLAETRGRIASKLFWERRKRIVDEYNDAAGVDAHPSEEGVLVKIGEEIIKEDTIASILEEAAEEKREKIKEKWREYFIKNTVFSREAERVNLQDDPEVAKEVNRKIDRILAKVFRQRFLQPKLKVSEEDIKAYYQSHLEMFRRPLMARVQSILAETKEEAEKLLKELKDGVSFDNLAVRRSLHPDASTMAGYQPWFTPGEKNPVYEKAVFALEQGQITDVIKTEAGYEILRLAEKRGGDLTPLSDKKVRNRIQMELVRQRLEKEKQHYYEKAGVKIVSQ